MYYLIITKNGTYTVYDEYDMENAFLGAFKEYGDNLIGIIKMDEEEN